MSCGLWSRHFIPEDQPLSCSSETCFPKSTTKAVHFSHSRRHSRQRRRKMGLQKYWFRIDRPRDRPPSGNFRPSASYSRVQRTGSQLGSKVGNEPRPKLVQRDSQRLDKCTAHWWRLFKADWLLNIWPNCTMLEDIQMSCLEEEHTNKCSMSLSEVGEKLILHKIFQEKRSWNTIR